MRQNILNRAENLRFVSIQGNGQYNNFMKNLWKHVKLLILCILPIAILLFACLAAYPVLTVRSEKDAKGYSGILRIWQIDNFEGGTGSRSAFINRAARSFEAVNEGTLILVTAHTEQSAASSIAEGNIPDMISFGTGADFVGDIAQPLRGYSFPYAQIGKETYAYPWCRGGYFLLLPPKEIFPMYRHKTQ